MKRVMIFRLFVLLIVTISAICTCKYGFYKEVKVSFPNKNVKVCDDNSNHPYLKIPISANSEDYYSIEVTKDQANCFLHNNYYNGRWYEMHLSLHVIFWLIIAGLFIYYIWSVVTLYMCLYNEESNDFSANRYCNDGLCPKRCDLYNSINTYDLTPVKNGWLNFWGYSV